MRWISGLIFLLLISSCAMKQETKKTKKKFAVKTTKTVRMKDEELHTLLKRKIPRTGQFSTVTEGDLTTETYRREKSESLFTLEKGELRSEVEKREDGKTLTRTWQDGKLTTLTLIGEKSSTMLILDGEGNFVQKIITKEGSPEPKCWEYEGKKAQPLKPEDCLELLSGFD